MESYPGLGRDSADAHDHDLPADPPPPAVGQDERRMQVRAYNFWAGGLTDGPFPAVAPLLAGHLPDFSDHSVLLHFDEGIEDPAIAYIGSRLAEECEGEGPMHRLSDVPGRSLLSRITDHYMQIIANQAPIGFEAEFVNLHGRTILYRGILLPYSSDGQGIDYIYGVINWKQLADQETTDELLLEIGQSLEGAPRRGGAEGPLGAWADGPATLDLGAFDADILPFPGVLLPGADSPFPDPAFGDAADAADAMPLAEWLAAARDLARQAHSSEDRTRNALYAAIGRSWDFALAAQEAPAEYERMVADAGLTMQARAPLTPLVKLVFGADYDKTRIAEYATVLGHAQRLSLPRGALGAFLADVPGGLKAVVATERRLRREEAGRAAPIVQQAIVDDLRALPARPLSALAREGAEFALLVVRRLPGGEIALVGEVPEDQPLFERVARRLVN